MTLVRKRLRFKAKLYKFQKEDLELYKKWDCRVLDGSEMGLGKTVKALSALTNLVKRGPFLVVSPATIKYDWESQAAQHVEGLRTVMLHGRKPSKHVLRAFKRGDQNVLYIVNYDILHSWVPYLCKIRPRIRLVIADECQRIKNPAAGRTKALVSLINKVGVKHLIFLGGTAGLENRTVELWPILSLLRQSHWRWKAVLRFRVFAHRYSNPRRNPWGRVEYNGAKRLPELHRKLKTYCLIRRRKKDVLKDLPPVQVQVVPLQIENFKEYKLAEAAAIRRLYLLDRDKDPSSRVKRLALYGDLIRSISRLKMKAVREWIDDYLESSGSDKLLGYGIHKIVVKGLNKQYEGLSVRVDGSITGRKRRAAIDKFNEDPSCRLFFGNLIAAGEGWSCRSASDVAFFEVFWKPSAHDQAASRVRGIKRGLKGRPVRVFWLIGKDTFEERMLATIQRKQDLLDEILDGGDRLHDVNLTDELRKALLQGAKHGNR